MGEAKNRAGRNRTINLSSEEEHSYLSELGPLTGPASPFELTNRLIFGDFIETLHYLPESFVDLLFIDPPYNLTRAFNSSTFYRMDMTEYGRWFESWFAPLLRTVKPEGSVYVCGDWKSGAVLQTIMEKYLILRNRITWERDKGRGARTNWKNNTEDVWFGTISNNYTFNLDNVKIQKKVIAPYRDLNGSPRDWNDNGDEKIRLTHPSNIWNDLTIPFWSMQENTDHPTQKPEKMLARIILASSNPGDLVLDPFAGSGTTPAVSRKLNRRYLAFEKDGEYAAVAAHRIRKAESDRTIQGYKNGVFLERNARYVAESESIKIVEINDE